MPLPNFRINPYIQPYVGGVNQEFADTLGQKLAQYNANTEQEDALSYANDTLLQHTLSHPQDIDYAKQIMNDVRENIKNRVEKGDYENMGREIKRSARNFQAQIQPLLDRKAQYNNYVANLSKLEKVDEDTKRKALAYSQANDKGIDREHPYDSQFNGFIPSNTVNVGDELDKFYQGWKADKGSRDIINPDGTISKISWEQAQKGRGKLSGEQLMQQAGAAYIRSKPDIQNYLQTQHTIGNTDRVNNELDSAMKSNLEKHYYNEYNQELGFVPEHLLKKDEISELTSGPSGVGDNAHNLNLYKGSKLSPSGNLTTNNDYLFADENGNYNKYVDSQGKVVPISTVVKEAQNNQSGGNSISGYSENKPSPYKKVPVSKQEQQQMDNAVNKSFNQLELETYADDNAPNNLSEADKLAYAGTELAKMSPIQRKKYREEVKDRYDQAQELNKRTETAQYIKQRATNIKTVGDSESISDSGVLTGSLAGRGITLLNKPKGVDVELTPNADINELYSQLGSKWKVKKVVDDGWLKGNPSGKLPGSVVTLHLENEDGEQRDLKAVVNVGKADLKPNLQYGQDVMSQVFSGNSGFVSVPGTKAGYYIQTTPAKKGSNGKLQEGSQVNRIKVIEYDDQGKPTGVVIPGDAFYDYYIHNNPTAQKELSNFVINK